MRGRRSRRRFAVDVGYSSSSSSSGGTCHNGFIFEFYSTRIRRQNVHVHKTRGGKMLLLRNCLMGITTPTDIAAAGSTNRKYVGNAVTAELLVGDHDPLQVGSYISRYRDLLSIRRCTL